MKGLERICGKKLRLSGAGIVLAALNALNLCNAQVYTLNDENSQAIVNTASSAGMSQWAVYSGSPGYVNYLDQQWFWYRTTSQGAASPINTISSSPTIATPYGVGGRALSVTYATTGYNVRVDYLLTGGSLTSGQSDIGETITINNTGNTTLAFHLFQYSDFNLSGSDTVELGKNLRGFFNEADQSANNGMGPGLTETVVTPGANHGEAALEGATLTEMASPTFTTLNDNAGPVSGGVTWAFEWDLSIAAGGSAVISKDKLLNIGPVPEPGSLALFGIGLAALVLRKRNR